MDKEIFKIRKDIERAREIFEIAKDRYSLMNIYPKSKTYKIIEEYYETIKEIFISSMYFEGEKTLSHIKLIEWFNKNYKNLSRRETELIDSLRRFRNGSLYYGKTISKNFLENTEKEIIQLIEKLIKFTNQKLKWNT